MTIEKYNETQKPPLVCQSVALNRYAHRGVARKVTLKSGSLETKLILCDACIAEYIGAGYKLLHDPNWLLIAKS